MKFIAIIIVILLVACAKAPVEKAGIPKVEKVKPVAVLAVQSGLALVNGNPASPGLELSEGDVVSTSAGAKASIVFFDSTVLRLDENTEIEVKSIVKGDYKSVSVKQFAGSTWSRVLKVSGIKEYSVETPNTVATVRGTGFAVIISDGDSEIKVREGSVHVASLDEGQVVAEAVVTENFEVEISDESPTEIELEALEADEWVDENLHYDELFIEEVIEEYVEEHPEAVEGMTEEQAEEYAEEVVTGGEYVEEVVERPVEEIVEQPSEEVVEEPVEEIPEERRADEMPSEEPVDEIVINDERTEEDLPVDERILDHTAGNDATGADTAGV